MLISTASGSSGPHLVISVPAPPYALLEPSQFHRLQVLLDEAHADAVLLTSHPELAELADRAGIPTEMKPEYRPSAPPPDFEEEPLQTAASAILSRRRSAPEGINQE